MQSYQSDDRIVTENLTLSYVVMTYVDASLNEGSENKVLRRLL
jgi:hypothetical protein